MPTANPTRLRAEAIIAAGLGIFPTRPPSEAELRRATDIPHRWQLRLRRWLTQEQQTMQWVPPPEEQSDLQDKLIAPVDQDVATGLLEQDMDVGVDLVACIQNARTHLAGTWPSVELPGVLPEVLPLATDDYAEAWSLVRIVDEPTFLLDELDAWNLSMTQVAAFKACLPELYAMVNELLNFELVEHVVKKRQIGEQHEAMIRLVRGLPPEASIALPETPKGDPKPARKPDFDVDFKALRTPAQAQEARSTERGA